MNNPFDEIRQAVNDAKDLNRACDQQANNLAELLDGRLRHVNYYRLKRLKAQLRDFNAHTGNWKED